MTQSSSAARAKSEPLPRRSRAGSRRTRSPSAGSRSTAACTGRRRRRASLRRPPPRTTTAWWPIEWPPVGTTETPGRTSRSPSAQPSSPQRSDEAELRLVVGGDEPRILAERDLPLGPLGDDPALAGTPATRRRSSRPPAWSKWRWLIATTSTEAGSNPAPQGRHDRRRPRSRASRGSCRSRVRRFPSRQGRGRQESRSGGS